MSDANSTHVFKPTTRSKTIGYAVGIVVLLVYCAFLVLTFFLTGGWLLDLIRNHYVFFIGLPFAAIISFITVTTLETTRGDIQFEAAGMKFKGASGPIIMWVLVYIAIVVSFSLAWPLK